MEAGHDFLKLIKNSYLCHLKLAHLVVELVLSPVLIIFDCRISEKSNFKPLSRMIPFAYLLIWCKTASDGGYVYSASPGLLILPYKLPFPFLETRVRFDNSHTLLYVCLR